MNLDKADVKIATAHEIGVRLEDILEATTKDLHRYEGAANAYRVVGDSISNLCKLVDKEMDEGKYDLEFAKIIKRYIDRASQMAVNLSVQAEQNKLSSMGRVQAMTEAVEAVHKIKLEEQNKVTTLRAMLLAKNLDPTNDGARPGPTLKQQRLAEEPPPPQEVVSDSTPPTISDNTSTPIQPPENKTPTKRSYQKRKA